MLLFTFGPQVLQLSQCLGSQYSENKKTRAASVFKKRSNMDAIDRTTPTLHNTPVSRFVKSRQIAGVFWRHLSEQMTARGLVNGVELSVAFEKRLV